MLILVLAMLMFAGVTATAATTSDAPVDSLDPVHRQLREFYLEDAPADPAEAVKLAGDLRADGSWSDIDYSSKDRAAWPVADHLSRVLVMAKALRSPTPSSTRQESLAKSIHSALAYWRQHDFKCPNWWHNRIGVPQKMGVIALRLDDQLRPEEFDYITKTVMPRCAIGRSTGQNRVWLAGCTLMDGLIQRDAQKVAKAASTIFAEAAVVTGKEGIQPDFSFHQHGQQQQFAAYGLSFAADQVKWMTVLRGTPWAMRASHEDVIRRYLVEGQNWTVWRGATDISCCGRGFAPSMQNSTAARLTTVMGKMSDLDQTHSNDYLAFVKRNEPGGTNDLIGCRHFWCSDYLVHRRKDFCVTLKMCSKRVTGSESLNGQNVSGYHLADGATYIYREGDEYRDVFPVWNWRMIPGVTCAQNDGPMPKFGSYKLDSDFVGAVTDGENGCAALDYGRDGVSARKSWFFSGDQVVCLGSGVRATPEVNAPLVTTISQCRLRGKVRVSDGKTEITLDTGVHSYDDLQWVEHDGIRYVLPAGQKVRISNRNETGNWSRVAQTRTMPKEDVSEDVFALCIEHGNQPVNGSYAYCVSPAAGAGRERFDILSNTQKLQAVRFGSKLVGAVFYAPGLLEYASGCFAEADSPCVLLLDIADGDVRATVADPTHSLKTLGLKIGEKEYRVQLPAGDQAGRSVVVQ